LAAPKFTVVVPSEKPDPVRVPKPPLNAPLMFISTCVSVGTTCSNRPTGSRASRTVPVVAAVGTTTVRLEPLAATFVGATVCAYRLPLSSTLVNTI